MILKSIEGLKEFKLNNKCQNGTLPQKVLMVHPKHYRVEYAINPHMLNEAGELNKVDLELALKQWTSLKEKYESLGFNVSVLEGPEDLPDMVFSANQSFPFIHNGKPSVILSHMSATQRQPEVLYFKDFFISLEYEVFELESPAKFEGNGDAFVQPGTGLVWGGYGYRTDYEAYEELSERFNLCIVPLKLVSPEYYHLDTCFSILDHHTAVYLPDAFDEKSISLIKAGFDRLVELDPKEAFLFFPGNCHSPNEKDVIVQEGATQFNQKILDLGYRLHEVDTSEYIKSGGSVFCLKMMYV